MEKFPLHIKNPELQTSEEVQRAVKREERHTGEKVPNDPTDRIEAYMDRLENIFLNPDEETRKRNIELFRDKIHDKLIIKRENFPESYFELQKRIAREQGHGNVDITAEMKEQMMDTAIKDQEHSLDAWIDYLTSEDAVYPAWFKYYAWNQVIKLSQFDKERGEYKKRTDSTVAPFPDIYREPLARIADLYERVRKNNKDPEARKEFDKKFPALYAELTSESLAAQIENKEEVKGEWVKFEQGGTGQAEKLYKSLEGKGTGWCTAGLTTAETQIESGDFYVYYTYDNNGEPTQPRLAIRMNGKDKIGEVRGILPHQNVEPIMQGVLDEKLKEFGGEAEIYKKKSEDMRQLTELEHKKEKGEPFTKADLTFLYEINSQIEGFGYKRDPRIEELRKSRNTEEDMAMVFDCTKEQIAKSINEANENTVAYVGEWNVDVYNRVLQCPNIKYYYESFPDKKIFMMNLETDPNIQAPEQTEQKFKEKNIYLSDWGKDILYKTEFSKEQKNYELVRFTVVQLGFPRGATTQEIYDKAKELGLELCPAEVGPHLRLAYGGKEWMSIAMKQISGRGGYPGVFGLGRGGAGLALLADAAEPSRRWVSYYQFVFLRFQPKSGAKTETEAK